MCTTTTFCLFFFVFFSHLGMKRLCPFLINVGFFCFRFSHFSFERILFVIQFDTSLFLLLLKHFRKELTLVNFHFFLFPVLFCSNFNLIPCFVFSFFLSVWIFGLLYRRLVYNEGIVWVGGAHQQSSGELLRDFAFCVVTCLWNDFSSRRRRRLRVVPVLGILEDFDATRSTSFSPHDSMCAGSAINPTFSTLANVCV